MSHEMIDKCVAVIFCNPSALIIALIRVKEDLLRHLIQLLSLSGQHKFKRHFLVCIQVLLVWPQIIKTTIFVAPLRDVLSEQEFLFLIQLSLKIRIV